MLFKHFYDPDLAQGSYLIGCQATGEAIVIDARRDIDVFIKEAEANGMKIVAVTETHIHADYLSGSRELANATGAQLYLSDEGNADWKYGFDGIKLYDNDEIKVGNIVVKAQHTPGHTPEHLSFLVTDGATTENPGFYLTGDFVFVGDIGRPDLLDEAAGGIDTRFVGAKQLFQSLKNKFLNLPDYVQVWPAHGAGSACGKALGAIASTTVGYERLFSWWAPFVLSDDEEGFSKFLLEGQPDAPLYFGRMKRQNKAGPAILGNLKALEEYNPSAVEHEINGDFILVDTRSRDSYMKAAVPGALHIPYGKQFVTYASYVIDPEADTRPIIVVAKDAAQAENMRQELFRVGIDKVVGYITSVEDLKKAPVPTVSIGEFKAMSKPYVLDVRTKNEYSEGHIEGAHQLHAGRVLWHLHDLPEDETIVSYCRSGARVAVAASALRAAGFKVAELEGSWQGWEEAQKELVNA
ncbi:MAG: MBL fold metallo-hydrolase [Trueperaceae bacterium]|nr:MBL fold metallo-hydrolase [Trueperaceae bacterium]